MTNELQTFKFEEMGIEISVIMIDGEPHFIGKEVTTTLGYKNSSEALKYHVDGEDKLNSKMLASFGQRGAWLINESGLYSLILNSHLESAKKFKRWVTKDVLPQIRQTGGYIPIQQEDTEQDILAKAFLIANKTIEKQKTLIESQTQQLLEQKPLVTFAERCMKSKDNILVRELSKIIQEEGIVNIGEKKLYQKLRDWNLVLKSSTEPSQKAMNSGYFVVEQKVINTPYGEKLSSTTKVTPKGQVYIVERLDKENSNIK